MKKILISVIGSVVTLGSPVLALAASFQTGYIDSLTTGGLRILSNLLIFLVSLAVVWFIWNVIRYTMSEAEDDKSKAKSQMVWGIIAITVIVSVWAIEYLLESTFLSGVSGNAPSNLGNMIPLN